MLAEDIRHPEKQPNSSKGPLRQTQRSPEGPRHLHRIPRLSEAEDLGCFSGCLMSSAGIQKLFCGIYSTFKCSFDEFVGETQTLLALEGWLILQLLDSPEKLLGHQAASPRVLSAVSSSSGPHSYHSLGCGLKQRPPPHGPFSLPACSEAEACTSWPLLSPSLFCAPGSMDQGCSSGSAGRK